MNKTTKILSIIAVVLCCLTTGVSAEAITEYTDISVTVNKSVDIATAGEYAYFKFVPTESGIYMFQSHGSIDTYGYLYDKDGATIASNDDSGDGSNFCIISNLIANEIYYLGARLYSTSNTGSFTVSLEKSNLQYTFDESTGKLEFSGEGNLWDDFNSLIDTDEEVKSIVINDGITSIGNTAFSGFTSLENVEIADTVTAIGTSAFRECTSLKTINIPDSVLNIGSSAFSNCSNLTEIILPTGISNISPSLFAQCSALVNVHIPNSVTKIGSSSFRGCSSLENIVIPENVNDIGSSAFNNCVNLTQVNIPKQLNLISSSLFANCSNLATINIPETVISIGDSAFRGCTSLTNVIIPNSVTTIGSSAFYNCSKIAEINISDSVTNIESSTFYNCVGLVKIKLPKGLDFIGDSAFYNCTGLTNITIPENVSTIGANAFSKCENLSNIELPVSISSINSAAFSGCTKLEGITMPKDITSLSLNLFSGCNSLKNIWLENNITKICNGAFDNCSSLKNIYYSGKKSEWNKIMIGKNNTILKTANKHFSENDAIDSSYDYVVWDGTYDIVWSGSGTSSSPYLITTPEELAGLSYKVNTGTTYSGKYFSLEADIYLNDIQNYQNWTSDCSPENDWIPIGGHDYSTGENNTRYFSGKFDGKNHTIYGMYYSNTSSTHGKYVGLFGYVNGGTYQNININNSHLVSCSDTGILIGYCNSGYTSGSATIQNINISNNYIKSGSNVGGLIGYCQNNSGSIDTITISNCTIYSGSYTGGLVGYFNSYQGYDITNCIINCSISASSYTGGFVGYSSSYGGFEFENCTLSGMVKGSSRVGGISGYAQNTGGARTSHENCINNASITGTSYVGGIAGDNPQSYITSCINSGDIIGTSYVGGIIGDCSSTGFTVSTITGCLNYGNINASSYVGGITGYTMDQGYGGKYVQIKNCMNTGNIKASGSDIGGIVGRGIYDPFTANSKITNCFNTGDIEGYNNVAGIIGYCYLDDESSLISNVYNSGDITGNQYVSGIVAYIKVYDSLWCGLNMSNLYNAGKINGNSYVNAISRNSLIESSKNCYYLNTNSSAVGTSLSSEQMKLAESFAGFDFSTIWKIDENKNNGYPFLQWAESYIVSDVINIDGSIDDYIIGEVKKYTSSGDLAQYNAIMSSDASWEEKFRRLNEFFNNEGITDIKEGTQYLTESNSYRYAYNCLTTNEMYGAFNYYNWLYSTNWGLAARSALYTSGLIFNYEVFSYMDLSTYTENDYPGVKKNKALLKEIMSNDSNNTLCDIFDYSNKTAKFLKNIVSLNKITMDNEMDALMDKIINCTSKEESQKLQKEFVEKIIAITGTTNSINMFSDNFADALDSASDILSFAGATVEDIVALSNLDADIEIYKKNSTFLYTIYSNPDVSFEMRLAAYQLYDEIENGYYNKVVSMLNNVIDFSLDKMYTDKTMLRTFLESQGISESGSGLFADALGTIKLATYITNIIIDTGDFVRQVAYTQGYAELATLYSLKLEEDKQAFLANETAENAWEFFEDYTMLWKLRYNGEQQYLDMSKVKIFIFDSIKTYKYEEKKELVEDNLGMLNKCKFKLAAETTIPKSVQYEKKSVVKCPVDVYVYNNEGELIATLKDGEESDVTNDYGRFAVVKESYSGEYAKVICQSTTEDLTIKMIAVDDGLVDYQSLATTSADVKTMDKLIVSTGNSIEVDNDSYSVDINSDGNADINGTLIIKDTNSYVAVESLSTADDNITLISGQTKTIGVTITPTNATNTALEWISLDKGVATVQNGLIKAIGSGTTTIIVRACDSNEIEREIVVTVLDKMEYEVLSHSCNENSLVGKINVKNNVDSKMVATMYVAIYGSDGTFKDVSSIQVELDAKGETVKDVNIENYVYTTGDYIKIFIWGENLIPFCKTEKTLLVSVE